MKAYLASLGLVLHLMVPGAFAQPQQAVVSLDYCADQYVLALSERQHIRGLSPASQSSYAYYKDQAQGFPQLRAEAETIIDVNPTIVVRQWGGGFQAPDLLKGFGIDVAQIGFGHAFETAERNLRQMGDALHAEEKAEELIRNMRQRLDAIDSSLGAKPARPRALYLTPGGVSAGKGTFVDVILTRAGVINITAEQGLAGWPAVDLEDLVLNPPDLIITGFFDLGAEQPSHWSIARHSYLQTLFDDVPTLHLPGRLLACSAWFSVEAVEHIYEKAHPKTLAKTLAETLAETRR